MVGRPPVKLKVWRFKRYQIEKWRTGHRVVYPAGTILYDLMEYSYWSDTLPPSRFFVRRSRWFLGAWLWFVGREFRFHWRRLRGV